MRKKIKLYDSPEDIKTCLSCDKPSCDNCMKTGGPKPKAGRKCKAVIRFGFGPDKCYPSAAEAAEDVHAMAATIRNAALYGHLSCGYYWRYKEE